LMSAITSRPVARRILEHLGLPAAGVSPPRRSRYSQARKVPSLSPRAEQNRSCYPPIRSKVLMIPAHWLWLLRACIWGTLAALGGADQLGQGLVDRTDMARGGGAGPSSPSRRRLRRVSSRPRSAPCPRRRRPRPVARMLCPSIHSCSPPAGMVGGGCRKRQDAQRRTVTLGVRAADRWR
jgi:hypothetical protein